MNYKNINSLSGFVIAPYHFDQEEAILLNGEQQRVLSLDEIDSTISQDFQLKEVATHETSRREYTRIVDQGIQDIKDNHLKKVVLSRVKFEKYESSNLLKAFLEGIKTYAGAFVCIHYTHHYGLWFGCSPEILVKEQNNTFETMALAGTQPEIDNLKLASWTQKEIEEQAFVSRYVINSFKKLRLREFDEDGPKTVRAGRLLHLCTKFSVNLKDTDVTQVTSHMLELLHPTSAVCGMPKEKAAELITNLESHDRKLFCGFLGPINLKHETQLFVNLRCAEIGSNGALLYAGAGITEDSVAENEWNETNIKCLTIGRLLD